MGQKHYLSQFHRAMSSDLSTQGVVNNTACRDWGRDLYLGTFWRDAQELTKLKP